MEPRLTRRQEAIYEFLREHAERFPRPPTLDELCQALHLHSRGSLHKHIRALVRAGLVEPLNGRHRGIRLSGATLQRSNVIPLLGRIAAGRPIEAIEAPQEVEIPTRLRSNRPCYVLEVRGDSMIDAGIHDGDWVVIERRADACDGDLVVALIEGTEATLKRIEQSPGRVVLHPANLAMEPSIHRPEEVEIRGVVVGLMRTYR